MRAGYSIAALALLSLACSGTSGSTAALCTPAPPDTAFRYTDADAPLPRRLFSSTMGTVAFSDNTPPDNRITNAGAALGRVLFYDARLSANNTLACASCHQQRFGFGDTARFSRGLHGALTRRHAMALANLRFNAYGRFFWDERAPSLEAQVLDVIQDSVEMGMDLTALEAKLNRTSFYPPLFAAAFGSPRVTRDGIARAIAQFARSLISAHSRLDAVVAPGSSPDLARLSLAERQGYQLFTTVGCVNCHRTILQFSDRADNTGLDAQPTDSGADSARFKPASLRNVAVRPPYMHDGRFRTLRDVLRFYSTGVQETPGLDPRLRDSTGHPRRLNLTDLQLDQLEAFLRALTDTAFLHDPRFANPFPCRAAAAR
jgi:cytochrome c peroxidase